MATAGNLCTTIIGDLGRGDTSLSDIILTDIQSAITEYESQRFFFNEMLLTLTLSATDTYALTLFLPSGSATISDVIEIDAMDVIINSTRKYELDEKPFREWLKLSSGNPGMTGYPEFFSYWNRAIKVYPQANSNYTSEIWAHVRFAPIAVMGDSNPWTNEGADLIRNAALKRLWMRRFRDYDAAQAAKMAEADALKALRRKTEGLNSTSLAAHL